MAKSTKTGKTSKTETPSLEEWVRFEPEVYENAIEGLVHFSAKAVNSNAKAGGVRLSKGNVVDLPYLSVLTLGASDVGLDYTKNVGQISRITKQINSVLSGTADARFGVPPAEVERQIEEEIRRINALAEISEKKKKMLTAARKTIIGKSPLDAVPDSEKQIIRDAMALLEGKVLIDGIDCHIKQIVMPDMNGNDVTLSPLHAAGLSGAINEVESAMVDEINAGINDKKNKSNRLAHVHRIEMNFGGANPHNVGGLVREMQQPLFVLPPHEDLNAKAVFSIHYKGVSVVTNQSIDEFLAKRQAALDKLDGKKENMHTRNEIENALREVVECSLERGRNALDTLVSNTELLPVGDEKLVLLDEKVNPVIAGLILADKRNAEWRKKYSEHVAFAIMNRVRKIRMNGNWVEIGSGISGTEAQSMRSLIENEVLQ